MDRATRRNAARANHSLRYWNNRQRRKASGRRFMSRSLQDPLRRRTQCDRDRIEAAEEKRARRRQRNLLNAII